MKKKEAPANDSGPMVYCGPALPGVARQYTVYRNGIPGSLAEALAEKPVLRGLLLPLDRLPDARKAISGRAGPLYRLYQLAQEKQKEA